MGKRKTVLTTGCLYHVFSRSIAGFEIFRSESDYQRFRDAIEFYRYLPRGVGLSHVVKNGMSRSEPSAHRGKLVKVLAYCLMPTHFHLCLEQIMENGISNYMRLILNSYARYANLKLNRKGPLWESRFKSVRIETDEQALHLIRYIHLNPSSANLIVKPCDWKFSSYSEYSGEERNKICEFEHRFKMTPVQFRDFFEEQIEYQRTLQQIKSSLLD